MTKLATAHELAELLQLPVTRVYRLAREGEIPHFRVGRNLRFREEEVLSALAQPVSTAPQRKPDLPSAAGEPRPATSIPPHEW